MLRFLLLCAVVAAISHARLQADVDDSNLKIERETFVLINKYRVSEDLPALTWNADIAEIARAHSKDMATGAVAFGHGGFRERIGRLKGLLPGLRGAGENVLLTSDPNEVARTAVAMWLKSPPHLHNIRGDFNLSGIGVWLSTENIIYFTEIFVKLKPVMEPVN